MRVMTKEERKEAFENLKYAVEVAGDGGLNPFTDEEYKLMYHFLDEIKNEIIREKI